MDAVATMTLGDATPADVAAGKTFTSAAGLKVAGTKEDKLFEVLTSTMNNGYLTANFSFTPKAVIGVYYGETFTQNSSYPEIVGFIVKNTDENNIVFYYEKTGTAKITKVQGVVDNVALKFTITGNTIRFNTGSTSGVRIIPNNSYLIIGLSESITI